MARLTAFGENGFSLVVKGSGGYYCVLSNAHVIAVNSKAHFPPLGTDALQSGLTVVAP